MVKRAFISSTSQDLIEYRQVAIEICIKLGLLPIAMEHFVSMQEDAVTGSKKHLQRADIYIGIFAHRYGHVPDFDSRSVTEMEFDFAQQLDIPSLLFLIHPETPWPTHYVDFEQAALLNRFKKEKLLKKKIVSFFRSPDEFAYKLSISLIQSLANTSPNDPPSHDVDDLTPEQICLEPVFGPPSNNPLLQSDVFMIAPFTAESAAVYKDAVKPAVENLGLNIKRADDLFTTFSVIHDIWSAIMGSRIVIADVTLRNPNVYYELGITHTIGKPVILLSQNIDDIAFDLRQTRTIIYELSATGIVLLRERVRDAIARVM